MSLGARAHCGQWGNYKSVMLKTCLSLGCKGQGGRAGGNGRWGSTEGLGEGLGGGLWEEGLMAGAEPASPSPSLSEPCLDTGASSLPVFCAIFVPPAPSSLPSWA